MSRLQWLTQNWPIKLAAVFFAVVLWIAVASEEPTTLLVPVTLNIELPEGRALTQPLPTVSALIAGTGREMLKLRASPPEIRKLVPDTLSGSLYTVPLQPTDVVLPKGVTVSVHDLQPREVVLALDEVGHRDVPIVARVTVRPDSGYTLQGGIAIAPGTARLVGLPTQVARVDTVYTMPLDMMQVTAPFQRAVPIDTSGLQGLRVSPKAVEVAAAVVPLSERAFPNVLVRAPGRAFRGFTVEPDRVLVTVRGAASRILALTADSIRVQLELEGDVRDGAVARVVVLPPPGVSAHVTPATVRLRSRTAPGGRRG